MASEGKGLLTEEGEKETAGGCDICHPLVVSPGSPGAVFWAGGLGLAGRMTSRETLIFGAFPQPRGLLSTTTVCSLPSPRGGGGVQEGDLHPAELGSPSFVPGGRSIF